MRFCLKHCTKFQTVRAEKRTGSEKEREREHTGSHHLIPAVTAIIIPMNADLNTNILVVYHFLPLIGN